MAKTDFDSKNKLSNIFLFVTSLIPIIVFLFIVYQRAFFPYDIEWAEGAALNQVNRILAGKPLYVKPSLEFAPLVYTPVYYYLAALVSLLTGKGLIVLRLISVIGSLGSSAVIYQIVKDETSDSLVGWTSASLFLACFALSDGFFDLARVDSIYLLSLLIGLLIIRRARSAWAFGAAGLWIAFTFFVKQSAIIVFLPMIVYVLLKDYRKSWTVLAGSSLGILLPFCIIDYHTEGWFRYYILGLPRLHGYSLFSIVNFWIGDILRPLGIAVGLALYYIGFGLKCDTSRASARKNEDTGLQKKSRFSQFVQSWTQNQVLLLLFSLGALASAWITRSTNGGGANNSMPAYAVLALLAGLGFNLVLSKLEQTQRQDLGIFIKLLFGIQLLGLIYNPFNFLPSEADMQASGMVLDAIEHAGGEVFIPYRSHLAALAGKEPQIHMINLFEFTGYFQGQVQPEGYELVNLIKENICYQRYGLVILDQPIPWIAPLLDLAYDRMEKVIDIDQTKLSKALSWQGGYQNQYRPKEIYESGVCLDLVGN